MSRPGADVLAMSKRRMYNSALSKHSRHHLPAQCQQQSTKRPVLQSPPDHGWAHCRRWVCHGSRYSNCPFKQRSFKRVDRLRITIVRLLSSACAKHPALGLPFRDKSSHSTCTLCHADCYMRLFQLFRPMIKP